MTIPLVVRQAHGVQKVPLLASLARQARAGNLFAELNAQAALPADGPTLLVQPFVCCALEIPIILAVVAALARASLALPSPSAPLRPERAAPSATIAYRIPLLASNALLVAIAARVPPPVRSAHLELLVAVAQALVVPSGTTTSRARLHAHPVRTATTAQRPLMLPLHALQTHITLRMPPCPLPHASPVLPVCRAPVVHPCAALAGLTLPLDS